MEDLALERLKLYGPAVVRLIRTAFGRLPDQPGLLAMVDHLGHGGTLDQLAEGIVASPEWAALHGTGQAANAAFAARLRCHVFGSPGAMESCGGSPGTFAQTAAQTITRAGLLVAISQSLDAIAEIPLFPGLAPESEPDDPIAYRLWLQVFDKNKPAQTAPAKPEPAQAGAAFDPAKSLMSVVMACSDVTWEATTHSIASLLGQTSPNWELCLGSRLMSSWPLGQLKQLTEQHPRIRAMQAPPTRTGEAAAQDAGLARARGALVCFVQPGDLLSPVAIDQVQAVFEADPSIELVYSDEDRITDGRHSAPRFKRFYSPDAMLAGNAIGQLAVFRRNLLTRIGGVRPEVAGGLAYDLAVRAAAAAGAAGISHLPQMLFHRSRRPNDWPVTPALQVGLDLPDGAAIEAAPWPRARFPVPAEPPLVSIIMLTRDRAELLAASTAGVLEDTDYPRLELLIVDNASSEPAAVTLLDLLASDRRVRVLRQPGEFNFSAFNNFAAAQAGGEILLLLNNDVEILHADWLRELVSLAVRPGIGAVGARLLYPDGTLQHGGMALGPGGTATHLARGARPEADGYDGHLRYASDLSAVTGACLATPAAVYRDVGGMNEEFALTWNDVDYCQRVRGRGLRVLWTPHASLMHREGSTRGADATDPARQARFLAAQARYRSLWAEAADDDPFLNPNLIALDYGLRLATPRGLSADQSARPQGHTIRKAAAPPGRPTLPTQPPRT